MVSFIQAIKLFYKNYLNFDGRAQRSEYWWAILYQVIVLLAIGILIAFTPGGDVFLDDIESNTDALSGMGEIWFWIGFAFLAVNLLPNISLAVRRFHDLGQTGWLVLAFNLLGNIPIIGIFIFLGQMIWYALPGNKGANQYGPDPLGGTERVFD